MSKRPSKKARRHMFTCNYTSVDINGDKVTINMLSRLRKEGKFRQFTLTATIDEFEETMIDPGDTGNGS
jgi:hypothetical protein